MRSKELQALAAPDPASARRAATAKSNLERLQIQLAQPVQNLLPAVFKSPTGTLNEGSLGEMKDAIEAAKNDTKEMRTKLEAARSELAKAAGAGPRCGRRGTNGFNIFPP